MNQRKRNKYLKKKVQFLQKLTDTMNSENEKMYQEYNKFKNEYETLKRINLDLEKELHTYKGNFEYYTKEIAMPKIGFMYSDNDKMMYEARK